MKINFWHILTLIFVVAKLGGYIAWSWWLVFAPIWVGLAIAAVLFLLAGILTICGVSTSINYKGNRLV